MKNIYWFQPLLQCDNSLPFFYIVLNEISGLWTSGQTKKVIQRGCVTLWETATDIFDVKKNHRLLIRKIIITCRPNLYAQWRSAA